ncbi:hypothetical protein DSOL_5202 [Desulfosporosinus metallidurans]|uniref:Uncharacterized protein n=1 Tax=Desulfosporosinus metallidurans TaxID=1888891 RepID=A0A1Q8QER7_9FIRM|nr:hypothetical protein DSOL_5202 [Desulfosporosinus metallidurans]
MGYIFVYLYKAIDQDNVDSILRELKRILKFYGEYPKVKSYCTMWIADCYVLKGDYDSAYKLEPYNMTFRVTNYGKNHLEEIRAE